MQLLINDKEIALFLLSLIDFKTQLEKIELSHTYTAEIICEWNEKVKSFDHPKRKDKFKDKLLQKITKAVKTDLDQYYQTIKTEIENHKRNSYHTILKNIDFLIDKFGEDLILEAYKNSEKQNFVKSLGLCLEENPKFVRRKQFVRFENDCLIRNTVGNENLLVTKIDNQYPFWFIDSGYTNFLESNKKWHRIVRNHLHFEKFFEAPADRLHNLKSFPLPWRSDGDRILVIEPGLFAAAIFHIDIKTWKIEIEQELRKYTDKKIVFREKITKKARTSLHRHLLDEDYHCVVSINSNAATESIWAGIPVITLDKHITNSISTHKISDINNLKKPCLGNWLCMLTYNQFTYQEIVNGTAVSVIKKYHEKI